MRNVGVILAFYLYSMKILLVIIALFCVGCASYDGTTFPESFDEAEQYFDELHKPVKLKA